MLASLSFQPVRMRLGALLSDAMRDGAELDVDHVQSALAGGRTLGELLLATAGGNRAAFHARGAAAGTVLTQPVATLSANV